MLPRSSSAYAQSAVNDRVNVWYTHTMAFCDPEQVIAQLGVVPRMHVADFGAGAGYFSVAVAERVGSEGVVYVIDIQQELLTKVTHIAKRHHLDSLVYVHADLEGPEGSTLPQESVDLVLLVNVLFQMEQKLEVLKEAYRVLRSGGYVLVVDWTESYGGLGPQPEHVLTERDARALLKEAGFSYHKRIDAGAHHYGILCRKKHG